MERMSEEKEEDEEKEEEGKGLTSESLVVERGFASITLIHI